LRLFSIPPFPRSFINTHSFSQFLVSCDALFALLRPSFFFFAGLPSVRVPSKMPPVLPFSLVRQTHREPLFGFFLFRSSLILLFRSFPGDALPSCGARAERLALFFPDLSFDFSRKFSSSPLSGAGHSRPPAPDSSPPLWPFLSDVFLFRSRRFSFVFD